MGDLISIVGALLGVVYADLAFIVARTGEPVTPIRTVVRTGAFRRLLETNRRTHRFEPVDPVNRTGVQSSMPNPSKKNGRCNVPPAGGTLHRLAQSSLPNPSEKKGRCNVPPAGGTLHRLFPIIDARSSMPDHRCPIHRKQNGVAMCRRRAAHCTDFSNHRCPIIGARSSMADH